MKIAFIGLGAMGRGMAATLVGAGHEVVGYDVQAEALGWLEERGGRRAGSPAEAADGAGAAILMVLNAAQAEAALFGEGGAVQGLPGGALVLCGVTMPPAQAEALGARVEEAGLYYLDAPCSGGTAAAETGRLTFMASGSDAAWERAEPLLEALGERVFRLGDRPGPGSTMKTVHQLAAGANLAVAAEVMSFGAHLGLDPERVLEILNVSAGGSWMIADRGPRMLTGGEDVKSAIEIFVKDLGIVLDAARSARFPAPIAATAHQVYLGAAGAGFARLDDSQATRFYERLGGAKVRKDE